VPSFFIMTTESLDPVVDARTNTKLDVNVEVGGGVKGLPLLLPHAPNQTTATKMRMTGVKENLRI
jgi:hypothetical protein